jgi:flagellar assembly factor FliW
MPTLTIQSRDFPYEAQDIITFAEGLIGLPHLRRMVMMQQDDVAPFLWLASIDDPETAFLVMDPRLYTPEFQLTELQLGLFLPQFSREKTCDHSLVILSIVTIAKDWKQSTINLRAPLVIAPDLMQGVQIILADSGWQLNAPLSLTQAEKI